MATQISEALDDPRFAYLVQGARWRRTAMESWCAASAASSCELIWLTFRRPPPPGRGWLHAPGSTWNSGRNALVAEAVRRGARRPRGHEYLIVADDDVELRFVPEWRPYGRAPPPACTRGASPYGCFQHWLLRHRPALGFVHFKWAAASRTDAVAAQFSFDALFNAFHVSTLSFLLPYVTTFDDESWFYSQVCCRAVLQCSMNRAAPALLLLTRSGPNPFPQWVINNLASMLVNQRRLMCPGLRTAGANHAAYPKGRNWSKPTLHVLDALTARGRAALCRAVPDPRLKYAQDPRAARAPPVGPATAPGEPICASEDGRVQPLPPAPLSIGTLSEPRRG